MDFHDGQALIQRAREDGINRLAKPRDSAGRAYRAHVVGDRHNLPHQQKLLVVSPGASTQRKGNRLLAIARKQVLLQRAVMRAGDREARRSMSRHYLRNSAANQSSTSAMCVLRSSMPGRHALEAVR